MGYNEEYTDGYEEGFAIGVATSTIEGVCSLLKMGYSPEGIAEAMDICVEKVMDIKENYMSLADEEQ